MDPDLERIRAAMKRTGGMNTILVAFFGGLGVLSLVRYLGTEPGMALVMGGLCFALAGLMLWLAARASPDRNPAAHALLHDPAAVTHVEHYTSSSSGGGFELQWLKIRAGGKTIGIRVPKDELVSLAEALARRCPNAEINVPGFRR
jgi:hypothetical protein